MKYNWNKEIIEQFVQQSDNFTEVLKKLNIPIQGNNLTTLKRKIKEFKIDISHFTFKKHYVNNFKCKSDIQTYLIKGSKVSTSKLKEKLFLSGLKENKCEKCGVNFWNGEKLICQLHHINGDHTDNRLENLQILCPNCHSQTDSYCGSANKKKHYYCAICGTEINRKSKHCPKCARNIQKKNSICPNKNILINDFKKLKSFVQVGKKYDVSDNTVKRWIKNYGFSSKKDLFDFINNN